MATSWSLYALCAPIVLLVRKLPAGLLIGSGVALALAGSITAPLFQNTVGAAGAELGDYWFTEKGDMSDAVAGWFYLNVAGRALGLMLIGVALFRLGIVQGQRDDRYYRRMARWGLVAGTAVTSRRVRVPDRQRLVTGPRSHGTDPNRLGNDPHGARLHGV